MEVIVNDMPVEAAQDGSVATLLEKMRISGPAVAVLLNGELVPAAARASSRLCEGDRIELFRFVAGG